MKLIKRPWGEMKRFAFNEKCTVKIISIMPREELSLQKHKKRKEMWYFLTEGYIQVGRKKKKLKKGSFIAIPKNTPHRMYAKDKKVNVLEVSFGNFDEKDEIRLEDKYGRK